MKRLFALAVLALSMVCAHAGPTEDLIDAMKAEQARISANEKERPQGSGQSVVRGYLTTKSGMVPVTASTSYLGSYASRAVVSTATAQLGMAYVTTLDGHVDVYVASPGSQYAGFMVMSWNDTYGNASEIYLMNTTLP
jgi:hypothetical protein